VKDLAAVVDKAWLRWYDAIYHEQSLAVHALDILKHIRHLKPKNLSSMSQVFRGQTLAVAT